MSECVSEPFWLNGDQIMSSESGELVAVVRNGVPVMQAGKNPLGKRVKEWMSAKGCMEGDPHPEQESAMDEEEDYLPEDEFAKDHVPEGSAVIQIGAGKSIGTAAPACDTGCEQLKEESVFLVDSIPDCSLPKFDPILGVLTPEFREFVKYYKVDQDQVAALVRRLERKAMKRG